MNFSSDERYSKIYSQLKTLIGENPRVLVLGIGENRMGDDGIGPFVSFHLSQYMTSPNVKIINGGIVPEERLEEITQFQPQLILIIDAAEISKKPGEVGIYEESRMLNYLPISSHSLPLPIFIDRCKQNIEGVKIYLVGIRPVSMEFLDKFKLYKEEEFSLDDKDDDPNIPFYAFNLSDQITKISHELIEMFKELLSPL